MTIVDNDGNMLHYVDNVSFYCVLCVVLQLLGCILENQHMLLKKWVKVCLKKIGIHGFPITVLLHHLDPKGTAQVISCI